MALDLRTLLSLIGEDATAGPDMGGPRGSGSLPGLAPSGYVPERGLTLPTSRGGDFLDRFALSLADMPAPTVRRGAGAGEQFLAGLLGGAAESFSRGRTNDILQRQLFAQGERDNVKARAAARDASFKEAKARAKEVRDLRVKQMNDALDGYRREVASGMLDPASLADRRGRIERITADLARLTQTPALSEAGAPPLKLQAKPAAVRTGATELDSPAGIAMSDEDLYLPTVQYAVTGQMPALGMGKSATDTRLRIFKLARKLFPGVNIAENAATFGANKGSLSAMQKMYDAATAFESTALKNSEILRGTLAKIGESGSPIVNKVLRSTAKNIAGDPALTSFNAALAVVQPEFARILSSPTMAGQLTDNARHEMQTVISPNSTVQQIMAALDVLKQDAENRRTAYTAGLNIIRQRISEQSALPGTVQPGAAVRFRRKKDGATKTISDPALVDRLRADPAYEVVQ